MKNNRVILSPTAKTVKMSSRPVVESNLWKTQMV